MSKENQFERHINILHGYEDTKPWEQAWYTRSVDSINSGQVGVNNRGNNIVEARKFWLDNGVSQKTVDNLVDSTSHWILKMPLHELVTKLQSGTVSEFLAYISDIYSQVEGPVQPTLDATAKFKSGFNGHTPDTHQKGLQERFFKILPDLQLTEIQIKLILMVIMFHDEGCDLGRSGHALNSVGLLSLIFGEDIFDVPELRPALRAVLFHDEPVVVPVLKSLIQEARTVGKDLPESQQVEILMNLLKKFGSIELFILLLLDKSDGRRDRVGNTRLNKLTTPDLWEDPHFLANMYWKIGTFGTVDRGDGVVFRIEYDFDLTPDEKIAHPANTNLVLQHKDRRRGAEVKMPKEVHETFRAVRKQKGYFDLISDIYTHLYYERLSLVVLSAFQAFPAIQTVEIALHDDRTYETAIDDSGKKQVRSNEDIVLTFSRDNLLSALESFKFSAENKTSARKIADALGAVEAGQILIPLSEKHV